MLFLAFANHRIRHTSSRIKLIRFFLGNEQRKKRKNRVKAWTSKFYRSTRRKEKRQPPLNFFLKTTSRGKLFSRNLSSERTVQFHRRDAPKRIRRKKSKISSDKLSFDFQLQILFFFIFSLSPFFFFFLLIWSSVFLCRTSLASFALQERYSRQSLWKSSCISWPFFFYTIQSHRQDAFYFPFIQIPSEKTAVSNTLKIKYVNTCHDHRAKMLKPCFL